MNLSVCRVLRGLLLPLLIASRLAQVMPAQNITGSITGLVSDASGGVVAGAEITIENIETGQSAVYRTAQSGLYQALNLRPGTYSVKTAITGFKTATRENVTLNVEDRLRLDFTMEVGDANTSVSVREEAPLVESQTASLGQVITARTFRELPIRGRNIFDLVGLAPGVQVNIRASGDVASTGTNAAPLFVLSDISINGGRFRTNDFTLDGVTIMLPENNDYAISPTPDGTQEFKVQTNSYGPEFGRSGGGVVNVVTRGGGNSLHGSLYEYFRNDRLRANNYFANALGQPRGAFHFNQFGASVGGPIIKNKTFFFGEYQGHRELNSAGGKLLTLPTAAMHNGDFLQLRASNGQPITIYDPQTTTPLPGGGFSRQPFPGNIIPLARFDPVALRLLKYLPLPNSPGTLNNWTYAPVNTANDDQWSVRVDHRFSDNHNLFGRVTRNAGNAGNTGEYGTIADNSFGTDQNHAINAVMNGTFLFSPTRVLNYRYGFTRRLEARNPIHQGQVNLSDLGLPQYLVSAIDPKYAQFPTILTGYAPFGQDTGDPIRRGNDIHSWVADVSEIHGRHTVKYGADLRLYNQTPLQGFPISQSYSFGRGQTQGPNPQVSNIAAGDGFASFLLGFGTGTISNAPALAIRNFYWAAFVNDEIKLGRLTINAGLRYDVEHPRTERYDRFATFDFNQAFPIQTAAFPAIRGTLTHPGQDGQPRGQANTAWMRFGPRIGLSYSLDAKTAIRMGYGIFYAPMWGTTSGAGFGITGDQISTDWVSSLDGVTPLNPLSNPFPTGFLQKPTTPAGKLQLGQSLSITDRGSTQSTYTEQWNFGIQRELPGNIVVEGAYAGNRGIRLPLPYEFNQLDPKYQALGTQLSQQVPNPYYGLVATGLFSAPTIARGQLLRPYPQYQSISTGFAAHAENMGSSIYHSFTARVEKRFSQGVTFIASYTRAKLIDDSTGRIFGVNQAYSLQNNYDLRAERSLSEQDVANRFVFSHTVDLPFGKGRTFLSGLPRAADLLVGGWEVSGALTFTSGFPLALASTGNSGVFGGRLRPNSTGISAKLDGPIQNRLNRYFDTSQFTIPPTYTFGNLARTLPDVRSPGLSSYDVAISKIFPVRERVSVLFRCEAFNLTNTPFFGGANTPGGNPGTTLGNPDFGVISSARNERQVQFSLKILW